MKKFFLFAVLLVLTALFVLPSKTLAFWPFDTFSKSSTTVSQTKFPTLIQRMIDKFKLNSGEVEKIVEEVQTER